MTSVTPEVRAVADAGSRRRFSRAAGGRSSPQHPPEVSPCSLCSDAGASAIARRWARSGCSARPGRWRLRPPSAAARGPTSPRPASRAAAGIDTLNERVRRPGRRHCRARSCSEPSRASTTPRCSGHGAAVRTWSPPSATAPTSRATRASRASPPPSAPTWRTPTPLFAGVTLTSPYAPDGARQVAAGRARGGPHRLRRRSRSPATASPTRPRWAASIEELLPSVDGLQVELGGQALRRVRSRPTPRCSAWPSPS